MAADDRERLSTFTPVEVWAGFDPRKDPLDVEVLKAWIEEGSRFLEVYFTGKEVEGEKVRIYAIYAAPVGGNKLPGMLHVHGGGQTVDLRWLKFWNRRGYATLTYNWGGEWPERNKYTLWGKLTHANHMHCGAQIEAADPDVRASSWYEWTVAAMRAVTLLEGQPEVDPDRLGAFGISMGGSIMWYLSAVDRRIKSSCAIYGAGWNTYRDDFKYARDNHKEVDEKTRQFRVGMSEEAYAPYIRSPMLFLSSTNDQHGNMDRVYDTLNALPEETPWRAGFTPGYRHHIGIGQADNLPLWMDAWLKNGDPWPKTPEAQLKLGSDGVPKLVVRADLSQPIDKVELYYAVENSNALNRYWRLVESRIERDDWIAALPVMHTDRYIFAFANVHYKSSICLSSGMTAVIPDKLGNAAATDYRSATIYDGADGLGGWAVNSPGTDPVPPITVPLQTAIGPGGLNGFSVLKHFSPCTYKIGDPKWRGRDMEQFSFRLLSHCIQSFAVNMTEKEYESGEQTYSCNVAMRGGGEWQTVTLPLHCFRGKNGQMLKNWVNVNFLELQRPTGGWEDENIMFTDFRWVSA